LISFDTKVNLAFILSFVSIIWNIALYVKTRNNEKARIYDKVYGTSEWLLMYEYNRWQNHEFESYDKDLEKAVRQHAKSHDMAQFFGAGFDIPDNLKSSSERESFSRRVIDEFTNHEKFTSDKAWEQVMSHNQSPVFCTDDEDFKERFDYVFKYVGENLSYFSPAIRRAWHDAQNKTVECVRHQYLSLNRLNESACEPFEDELVSDPYVSMLKSIRLEYRRLTRPMSEKMDELKWRILCIWYRITNITKPSI